MVHSFHVRNTYGPIQTTWRRAMVQHNHNGGGSMTVAYRSCQAAAGSTNPGESQEYLSCSMLTPLVK